MKTSRCLQFLVATLFIVSVGSTCVYADAYYQNFDSWTNHGITVGNWSEEGWSGSNVYIRGAGGPGWFDGFSPTNACWLFTDQISSMGTPLLTNTAGSITFLHRSRYAPNNAQIFVIESSLAGSSSWTTNATLTNAAIVAEWVTNTVAINSFSNIYVRIRKLDDGGSSAQMLAIDDISISQIPPLVNFTNIVNNPSAPPVNSNTTVSLTIAPLLPAVSNITAKICYSIDGGTSFTSNTMDKAAETNFSFLILGQPNPGAVLYYFEALYEINLQTSTKTYYPSGDSTEVLSYNHWPVMGDDRLENFDADWSVKTTPGTYTNVAGGWVIYDSLVRGAGPGYFAGISPLYAGWFTDIYSGYDPYLMTPLLNGVGSVYFAHRSKSIGGESQVMSVDISTNPAGPWEVYGYVTNYSPNPALWATNFISINTFSNTFVRIHKTADYDVANLYIAIDNVLISYPPADIVISNVERTKGYVYTTNEITVTCNVATLSTNIPASNLQPKLCYRMGSQMWQTNSMSKLGGGNYTGTIPPYPRGEVEYFVRCDFNGYYNVYAGNNETRSPAFSPAATPTNYAPSTYYSYIVRPYLSEFDYLSVTSSAGNATLQLVDDYTWQGVLDFSKNPVSSFTLAFAGYGLFTNGATEYSTATNFWGDSAPSGSTTPLSGTGQTNGAPISLTNNFDGPISFQYNTRDNSYVILRGFYQDFNGWNNASSETFERSIYGALISTVTNNFSVFTNSLLYYADTTNSGESIDFDIWTLPTDFTLGPALPGGVTWWYVDKAMLVDERGRSTGIMRYDKALALKNYPDQGSLWPAKAWTLDAGLGTFSFNYRCTAWDNYLTYYNNSGASWENIRVVADVSINNPAPDASLSLFFHYTNGPTGPQFYEYRFCNEVGTMDSNDRTNKLFRSNGSATNQIAGYHEASKSISGNMTNEVLICTNNANKWSILSRNGNTIVGDNYDTNSPVLGSTIGILPRNCDLTVNSIYVQPVIFQTWNGWNAGSSGSTSNEWVGIGCVTNNNAYLRLTNTASLIISPYINFTPGTLSFYYDRVRGAVITNNFFVEGSTNYSSWTIITNIATLADNATVNISSGISSYRWFRFRGNNPPALTNETQIDNIYIYGATNIYYNDFATSATNWVSDPAGLWTFSPNSYSRPGCPVPVGFAVDVAVTNGTDDAAGGAQWKTIASAIVSNSGYVTTNIDLEATTNYQPHAAPTFVRIRHTSGYSSLIVDDIYSASWRGDDHDSWIGSTQTDTNNWKAADAWVTTNATTGRYVELWRSKSPTNSYQYVQSKYMPYGVGSVRFDYKCLVPPVEIEIQTSFSTNDATFSPVSSLSASNTDWRTMSVSVNNTNGLYVRVAHTSTNNNRAILCLDNILISDYKDIDDTMWEAYNALITHNQDVREFEPFGLPASQIRTAYLNNKPNVDTGGENYTDTMPYIQTPRMSNGIGQISFWYRSWETNESQVAKIYLRAAPSRTTPATNWTDVGIGSISGITNNNYVFFHTSVYDTSNQYLRIMCDTNDINAKRICIDNIFITEPIGANFNFKELKTIPTVPLYTTPVYISAKIGDESLSPSNIQMTAHYYFTTNNWGTWPTPSGSIGMTNNDDKVYVTTNTIPARPIDAVVQYYIEATFEGQFANSPKYYRAFSNPSWYSPIDLNSGKPSQNPYYYSFSCTTGAVWINEYNIVDDYTYTNQYIELCGHEGAPITNWQLRVLLGSSTNSYTITNNATIGANITNGLGFWLLASTNVIPRDQTITNQLGRYSSFYLVRSMGAYADYVSDKVTSNHADDADWYFAVALNGTNTGAWSTDFTWGLTNIFTPRSVNSGQTLYNPLGFNPYVYINIGDFWLTGATNWINFTIIGTNYMLPAPWYSTNLTTTNWTKVPSYNSTNSSGSYTQWWSSLPGNVFFYRISATNIF